MKKLSFAPGFTVNAPAAGRQVTTRKAPAPSDDCPELRSILAQELIAAGFTADQLAKADTEALMRTFEAVYTKNTMATNSVRPCPSILLAPADK